jgi:lysophospholipase L1-like esterase
MSLTLFKKNEMKVRLLLLALLLGIQNQSFSQEYVIPENVNRILFIGNSITYSGQFTEYVETYLSLKYPENRYEFINVGLPSETVSGLSEPNHADGKFPRPDLHERLDRILSQTKPDLVFVCYGMNDGIYLPFDDERFEKFKNGIIWLHNEVEKTGAPILLMTPPIFDEQKGKAYANVLDIYSDWLISKRFTENWDVIDIHWPMKKYLEDKRLEDDTFVLSKDGVHPNEIGHFLMAKPILLYLGEAELAQKYSIEDAISPFKNGTEVLSLVSKRQKIMKDAWLTAIGHKRPSMNIGIPLMEAKQKAMELEDQLKVLLLKK